MALKLGDRVRIDIPDELDSDFNLHGEHAIVLDNDPGRCTCGCEVLYKVALETQDLSMTGTHGIFAHQLNQCHPSLSSEPAE